MKTLTLLRSYLPDRTIGKLDKFCTLERPWRNNTVNISCIPEGLYIVVRDSMGRHQYYRVLDVTNRTAIEFHGGITPLHSNGCVLVGTGFNSRYDLLDSSTALPELVDFLGEDPFMLLIRKYDPYTDGEF